MWGAFPITGEEQYLQKILDIIDKTKDFQNQKIIDDTKTHLLYFATNDLLHQIFSKSIKTRSEQTKKELKKNVKGSPVGFLNPVLCENNRGYKIILVF
jgi:hypothetical protein